MKSKKFLCTLLAIMFVFASIPFTAFAQSSNDIVKNDALYEELLSTNQLKEVPIENACDSAIKSEVVPYKANKMKNTIQKDYSNSLFNNIDSIFSVDYILNSDLVYEANCNDGSVIGFDNNMNIISYSNFNNDISMKSSTFHNSFNSIDDLKSIYNIDSTYQLSIIDNENYKTYCWEKTDSNNVINPYNSLKVVVDTNTNNIVVFNVFADDPSSEKIALSQDEAIEIALKFNPVFRNVTSCKLAYVKPNFYWNEIDKTYIPANIVRLTYDIIIDDIYEVNVDAETGEIISGSVTKKNDCGAYAYDAFKYATESKNLAATGFLGLGYNTANWYVGKGATLTNKVKSFLNGSNSYGFYIDSHGSSTTLQSDQNIIKSSQITGNWHFVFLDACSTAETTGWAKAFKIYGYSKRAFLGWSKTVEVVSAYQFSNYFWHEMCSHSHSTKYVRDTAVWAANQVPGSGNTPIRFYGDTTYNGRSY